MSCPCGNDRTFEECCAIIHNDITKATSAELLMRARYSAFVKHNIDFIYNSFHPSTRRFQNKKDIERWAVESKWMQLHVLKSSLNTVEFKAYYMDQGLELLVHHEKSKFKQNQGIWFYVDGLILSP